MTPLLTARGLVKHYPVRSFLGRNREVVHAVDGIDLSLNAGECFALVGESGSGKTTLGRLLVRLLEPTAGRLTFKGEDLLAAGGRKLRALRRRFQMVFQDPNASLNPRMKVGAALAEPLAFHGLVPRPRRADRVAELLELVGLPREVADRRPHELSGGQRQRVVIARALATGPELLVADEPVSALDVSVRAQILNLLADLRQRLSLTLLIIAHDLALVEQVADRVAVMYLGKLVEVGSGTELFSRPLHPYTVSLESAVPVADPEAGRPERIVLPGEPPSPVTPPPGCRFHPRCPIARPRCATDEPALEERRPGYLAACHFPGELALDGGNL